MTVAQIYIADDGTKFDTEWECEIYENDIKAQEFENVAFLYDGYGKQLPLKTDSYQDCYYIVAKTYEAALFIRDLFEGWKHPWCCEDDVEIGAWVYINGLWTSVESILEVARIIKEIV